MKNTEKVLITGASAGIGRATALLYAEKGAALYLVARRRDRLQEVSDECRERGAAEVRLGVFDLSEVGSGERLVADAVSQLGRVDVLILNAGYGCFKPVYEYPSEKMARMWQVNFQSPYESIQEALPGLLARRSGHIVLVSSVLGKKGIPYSAPYCATKFALVGLGQSIRGELRDFGIGVSVICPGYTSTEFHEVAALESGKGSVGRPMRAQGPESVAAAILEAVRRNSAEVHLTWQAKAILVVDRISNRLANRIMVAAGQAYR